MTWQDCALGDVVTLKRGHDLPERKRVAGPVPVVSSSGISGSHNEAKANPPGVVTGRYGTIELDPAYRAREPDRVAAQRIGRRAHTRSPLGMRHHRFERIEFTGQPCSQTVRQQAEGGVALGAVPASDLRPARGLARVGAVACQRAFAVRVIRAAIEPCIAPRLGPNVSLAGEPRLIPKLQPAVARRGRPPARANSFSTEGVSRLRHGSCDTKR